MTQMPMLNPHSSTFSLSAHACVLMESALPGLLVAVYDIANAT